MTKYAERSFATVYLLLCALPLIAAAPVTQLPGVIDATAAVTTPALPLQASSTTVVTSTATVPAAVVISPQALALIKELITSLNEASEMELHEKSGTAERVVRELRAEDGPDYVKLKRLLGQAEVRKELNPGAKGVLAEILSSRWDSFNLAGNLYLAALQSQNPDIRAKARQQMVNFIQPAHIPVLIHLLSTPGPNVLANEILQEVTHYSGEPTEKAWKTWWNQKHGQVELIDHLINQTRMRLLEAPVKPIDDSFWYVPAEVDNAAIPYNQRSNSEQNALGRWSDAARTDVGLFIQQWQRARPLFERLIHQPDPKVGAYLRSLLTDPGYGDYLAIVLAWRGDMEALPVIKETYLRSPTVGRAVSRGSLGDKTALLDLLRTIESKKSPISYRIMDDTLRSYAEQLPTLGAVSAELAFEFLAHQKFGLTTVVTVKEKRKAVKQARRWLNANFERLVLDKKRGYYVTP